MDDTIEYTLTWMTSKVYDDNKLYEHDLTGVFGQIDPYEFLRTCHKDGLKWDFLLVRDVNEIPRAVMCIQWYPITPYSLVPMIHWHILPKSGLWAIKHTVSILKSIADYYGLDKLSGDRRSQNKLGKRYTDLLKLDDIINWIK